MRKNKLTSSLCVSIAVLLVVILSGVEDSYSFWVYTPGSKAPINPKLASKDTPEEQFNWAMRLFKDLEFRRAADEFIKLTDNFRDSTYAPEAQYYAGRSFEEMGKYYPAFENYQKAVDNYPFTKRLEEIVEREYNIANIFQAKEMPKLMDLELSDSLNKAVDIYQKVVENITFGKYADKALFNMAECYRRLQKYSEAIETYNRIVKDYPESPLVDQAKYQTAYTAYEASLDPAYDQGSTNEALKKFEKIQATTPIPEVAEEAEMAISILKNRKADSLIDIAEFYEKQKKYRSAIIYYKDVISEYPETSAFRKAETKVFELEERIRK